MKQKTWERIHIDYVPKNAYGASRKILNMMYALKLKRLPDGTPSKYKARNCVRGYSQTGGVAFIETYALVVQWSTFRLALIMIMSNGWHTTEVDYTNVFD